MFKFFLLIIIGFFPFLLFAQLRLATYNIRADMEKDAASNPWTDRKEMIPGLVRFHDFDVFGLQEATPEQLADLLSSLNEYRSVESPGIDEKSRSQIVYKKSKLELQKKGVFWLSPDINKAKKAWDAKFARSCEWARFKDRITGFTFYYFNTHLDHVGVLARKNSVVLILEKIKEIAGDTPAVLSGDFNFGQDDDNYAELKKSGLLLDTYDVAKVRYTPNGTFNGFNINKASKKRIDHIFITKDFEVLRYGILTDNFGGKLPSDHFPVLVELNNKK